MFNLTPLQVVHVMWVETGKIDNREEKYSDTHSIDPEQAKV
jgi:hypothetical protein